MIDRFKAQLLPLDLIMVEDLADDAELAADFLREAGLTLVVRLVDNESTFLVALDERLPDAILSDWTLPNFSGRRAFAIAHERCPDVPFIFVSGTFSESIAFEALREGATDYVFKHQPQHLFPTLTRAVNEARALRSLRESENLLHIVLQTIPDLVWLKNLDGVYLMCNRMLERLFDSRKADIVGKTDHDFVDKELADSFRYNDNRAMAAGKPMTNSEWVVFADDGQHTLLETIKTPLRDARGKIIGVLGIARDVTEREMSIKFQQGLEDQLHQAQKMESVGRLAGGVAHDYNNMLNVIVGYSEMVLEKLDPTDSIYEDLCEIRNAGIRSTEITRQLLAFARKEIILPVVLDLNETVEGMLKILRRLIGEDIDLVWLPATGLWPVMMDPSQVDQIMANLCVNARDAIDGVGQVTIETDMVTFDEAYCADHPGFVPGEYVILSVSDDGCGMDRDIVDKIFEPFFTTKEVDQGTGLGLATVFGIVKQNGGFINVYSEPGNGSTFKIHLARHAALAVKVSTKSPIHVPSGHGEIILVVEDEAAILNLAKKLLEELGYTVLTANSPSNALLLVDENQSPIDLLITDVVMPGMNGKDLSNRLYTLYPGLKTLFMSGYTADFIARRGVLDEGITFIQKPFSKETLAFKVRDAMNE